MPTDTYISFYLRGSKIHVFRKTLAELGNPQFVRFRIHEDGNSMVMEAYSKKDFQSHRVPKKNREGWSLEIHSKPLCRIMMKHLNRNETQSYRIPGVAYPSQRIAVFDLTAAVMINQDGRQKDNLLEDEYNK